MSDPTEVLMQDVDVDINTGTVDEPEWTRVAGVTGVTHSPSTARADTKNFDTPRRERHKVVRRGDSFTISAQRQEDEDDGARDAGQEAVETAGLAVGSAAEKQYRLTSPGGSTIVFTATVQVTILGGGTDDVSNWQAEITVTGDITPSSLGDLPTAPTLSTGTNDDTFSLVSWTNPGVGGPFSMFEVTVYDEDDFDTVVTVIQSSAKPVHVAGLTNGGNYHVKVRAKNGRGWGPQSVASATITPSA